MVRLGEYDYRDDADGANHQDFEVAEEHVHPNRSLTTSYYDLALIKLNSTVNMGVSGVHVSSYIT